MSASRKDILIAARRKLLANASFAALIGNDVGRDLDYGGPFTDGWVFHSPDDEMSPERNARNTGTSSVVMTIRTPWTTPNLHNTLEFPELLIRIYSDATRFDDPSLSVADDGQYRCENVAKAIKNTFNDVANSDHLWPNGVYVVSCVLWNDLRVRDVPDEDGLVMGDLTFALQIG